MKDIIKQLIDADSSLPAGFVSIDENGGKIWDGESWLIMNNQELAWYTIEAILKKHGLTESMIKCLFDAIFDDPDYLDDDL